MVGRGGGGGGGGGGVGACANGTEQYWVSVDFNSELMVLPECLPTVS